MRIDFALLLIVAGVGLMDPTIVRGTELLQESVRSDGIAISQNAVSEPLDQILRKHEAQLARLVTLQSDWSVTYQNSAEDPARIEHWQTTIAPDYERSKRLAPGSEIPDHYLWDGSSFRQMLGYDSGEYSREPASIAAVEGLLYREDNPIHRLFQWRTLQSYRLYVSEGDQSLRELCEQSLREPKFSTTDGLVQIQLVHLGSSASSYSGTMEIPRGASILFEVDPAKGYLIRRHRTTFPLNSDGRHFSQEFSVQTYKELPGGIFLPSRVNYSVISGEHVMRQAIDFEYSDVNQPVETDEPFFVENLLVKEFESRDGAEPVGFFVVQADGTLGEEFPSEQVASLVRDHRVSNSAGSISPDVKLLLLALGVGFAAILSIPLYKRRSRVRHLLPIIVFVGAAASLWSGSSRDETVKLQIAKLNSAPDVGDVAPPINAVNLLSGKREEVELLGQVTLVEFWATWCGPCQHAMQELDKLASERGEQWGGQVQLVTISVDADHQAAERHLRTHGWLGTRTLVDTPISDSSPEDVGLPFAVARDYIVTGVPTCLIVDERGRIVFRGNPTSVDMVREIEQILGD